MLFQKKTLNVLAVVALSGVAVFGPELSLGTSRRLLVEPTDEAYATDRQVQAKPEPP
jgi:hypothetical protein